MNTAWFNAGRFVGCVVLAPLYALLAIHRWLFPKPRREPKETPDRYLESPPYSTTLHVCPVAGPWHVTKQGRCWCEPYAYKRSDGVTIIMHGAPRA